MDVIEACEKVITDGYQLLRYREIKDGIIQYDVKPGMTGKKRHWFYLDSFTASAILAVYRALKPENQAKIGKLPIHKLSDFAFKHVK